MKITIDNDEFEIERSSLVIENGIIKFSNDRQQIRFGMDSIHLTVMPDEIIIKTNVKEASNG